MGRREAAGGGAQSTFELVTRAGFDGDGCDRDVESKYVRHLVVYRLLYDADIVLLFCACEIA